MRREKKNVITRWVSRDVGLNIYDESYIVGARTQSTWPVYCTLIGGSTEVRTFILLISGSSFDLLLMQIRINLIHLQVAYSSKRFIPLKFLIFFTFIFWNIHFWRTLCSWRFSHFIQIHLRKSWKRKYLESTWIFLI